MAKHDERHLTTEQHSAFIDKKLAEQKLADYNAHLQTCEQCQTALASLQHTVAFLHALPQPALPRSFTLPEGISYLQERPARPLQPTPLRQPARRQSYIQRSLRAASVLAAVIGLVFLLSSILPSIHFGGGAASTASRTSAPTTTHTVPRGVDSNTTQPAPNVKTPRPSVPAAQAHRTPAVVASTPTAIITKPSTPLPGASQPAVPLLDLSTALGRQELGFILLALGIIGVILTMGLRRPREPA